MSAELAHLIERFQRHNLNEAASHLRVLKAGLEAHGLLPRRLAEHQSEEESDPPRPIVEGDTSGRIRLRRGPLSRRQEHELDALDLTQRQRHALLNTGFSTIAEVQFGVEHHLLPLVRHLSERSAEEIAERVRRYQSLPHSAPSDATP